jgi:hypothetical protein
MKCPHCKKEVEEKEQTKKKGYVITNRFRNKKRSSYRSH